FNTLTVAMKANPPAEADAPFIAKIKDIGMVPGESFDITRVEGPVAKALASVPKTGLKEIAGYLPKATRDIEGWRISTDKIGQYGTDYLLRALVAHDGLGANLTEDAVYPIAFTDAAGKDLTGANKYVLHFEKDQIPPVKAFWSLTMYNQDLFFVENPLKR